MDGYLNESMIDREYDPSWNIVFLFCEQDHRVEAYSTIHMVDGRRQSIVKVLAVTIAGIYLLPLPPFTYMEALLSTLGAGEVPQVKFSRIH